jgi:hypothetical protein
VPVARGFGHRERLGKGAHGARGVAEIEREREAGALQDMNLGIRCVILLEHLLRGGR